MSEREQKVFDWDDETEVEEREQRETVVLPEGNYDFTVIKAEKGYYQPKPGSKIPPCNKVDVYLRLDGGELGTGLAVQTLFLCEKQAWKAASFFRSIGLRKHDEPVKWRWIDHCDGEKGRCHVYVDTYQANGQDRQNNKVDRFFDPDPEDRAPAPAPAKKWAKGAF